MGPAEGKGGKREGQKDGLTTDRATGSWEHAVPEEMAIEMPLAKWHSVYSGLKMVLTVSTSPGGLNLSIFL